jgi:vacuolar-type H+-ATPase subunit H
MVFTMSVDFLKTIRETERECEQDIKNAETTKQNALMEAEKKTVLKIRDIEIQAKEEATKILSGVKDRVEKEYVKMLNLFEEEQNELKAKAKIQEKKAVDFVLEEIM